MSDSTSSSAPIRRLVRERYDVAISLNGRDPETKEVSETIARHLQRHGLKVFFYRDPEESVWSLGSDLRTRLPAVYAEDSRLVLLVASPNYGREGMTQLEWDAIRRRQEQSPGGQFLIAVSTVEASQLPEGVRDRVFLQTGRGESREWPQPVVRTIMRRLGRWPLVKAAVYYALLAAALLSIMLHWYSRTYVDRGASILVMTAIVSAVVWWLAFRIVPRIIPSVVYAPRGVLARLYNRLYLNLVAERVVFLSVLFVAVLAHAILPSLESEIQDATAAWLGSEPAERAAALQFFEQRVPQEVAVRLWTGVLVNEARYGSADRGRALDLIAKLLSSEEGGQQPVMKDVAVRIQDYANEGAFGLNHSNWPSSLSGMDASELALDHTDFARMHFAGKETIFARASLKQSDLTATYWQAVDFAGADVRWSTFARSSFLGIHGPLIAGGAHFPECTFFGCKLEGSDLFAADLTGAKFISCSLSSVDFTNAYLTGATFEDCDLTNAKFTENNARWDGRWGNLAGVTFIRCQMARVMLAGADFGGSVLSIYRAPTADPSNLKGFTHVYTRDPDFPGVDRQQEANISIPSTVLVGCQFRGYESRAGETVQDGTDFSGVRSAELLMDRETFSGLSEAERMQLQGGGFDPNDLLPEESEKKKFAARFLSLESKTWERIRRDVLDPLFRATAGNNSLKVH